MRPVETRAQHVAGSSNAVCLRGSLQSLELQDERHAYHLLSSGNCRCGVNGQRSSPEERQARPLVERGMAYRCYLSPAELAAARADAERERRPFRLTSPWRDRES